MPDPGSIDEAEHLRGQRRVGRASSLGIDADRLFLEGDAEQSAVALLRLHLLDDIGIHVGDEHDVVRVRGHCLAEFGGVLVAERQIVNEGGDGLRAVGRGEVVRVSDDAVADDCLGKHDRPGAVVYGAALGRDRLLIGRRLGGQGRERLALPDLPVGKAHRHASRGDEHDDQEQEEAAP